MSVHARVQRCPIRRITLPRKINEAFPSTSDQLLKPLHLEVSKILQARKPGTLKDSKEKSPRHAHDSSHRVCL